MPEDTTRLSARIQAGRERVTRTQLVTRVLQAHGIDCYRDAVGD